jgi:DNA-binding YbaB/EbfC family protein
MKFNPGMSNMNQMMKQAQKMQKQMEKVQEDLYERELEASSGGGAVSVRVNGRQQVLHVAIKPEVVDPDDVEMLEDLVLAAVNEALKQAQDMVAQEMGKITGGLNIPGLF